MTSPVRPTSHRTAALLTILTGTAASALLAGAPALAQQTAGPVHDLGTIFIESSGPGSADDETIVADRILSGSGLPNDVMDSSATISVVTSAEIERRGAKTTEQILQYTPGVTTDFYGRDDRYDYFKIRGYDATTYRDGLLIGVAFGGIREEPYAFDRVEVLKGANSTAFGLGDPGGAVNFITKSPTGERKREVYGALGSFNRKEVGFDIGDTVGAGGTWSWRLTGKAKTGEAETDFSNDDEYFLMAGLAWRPTSATTVSLVYDKLYRDGYPNSSGYPATGQDFDRSLFLGEPDFNYLDTDRDTLTFKVEHDFGNGLSFGSTARYTKGTGGFGYVFLGATTGPTTVSRFFFANKAKFENFAADAHLLYETDLASTHSRTMVGVEYRNNDRENTLWYTPAPDIDFNTPIYTGGLDLGATGPYSDTTNHVRARSIYLQQEFSWDRVIAQLGVRHDQIEQSQVFHHLGGTVVSGDFGETTVRAGLTYRATNALSFYGSYAESVVPAAFNATAGFGLEPERGEQFEIGVKYRPEGMRALFSAALFDLTKFNQTVTNPTTLLPEAIGQSRTRGLELEAKAEVSDALSFTAGYSYAESEIVQSNNGTDNGNELPHTPRHSGSVWVNYLVPGNDGFGDLDLGLGVRYTGDYWRNAANTGVKTDAAWIVDASVGYKIAANTEMRLSVTNLLDEKHVAQGGFSTDYYNAGREISLTLNHTW